MRSRYKLHLTKLDEFAQFAATKGYQREATIGAYEVLRLSKPGSRPIIVYKRERAKVIFRIVHCLWQTDHG